MTTYIVENQQPLNDSTEITAADFGVNLVTTQDVEILNNNSGMLTSLSELGASTVRFPGGSVTEDLFDIDHPNQAAAPSSVANASSPLIPLEGMFASIGQSPQPISVSLVIPTRDAFTTSAAEAALVAPEANQSYGSRDCLDPGYLGSPWEGEIPLDADGNPVLMGPDVEVDGVLGYVSYSLKLAEAYGVELTEVEIGNEFWGAGEMTASEYGFVAAQTALAINDMLNLPEFADCNVGIIVQTTSSASELYSPKEAVNAYVAEIDGVLQLLSISDINKSSDQGGYDGMIDPSWIEVVIPGQGSAQHQGNAIVAQFNALEGAGNAIDGIVQHYYESSGLDAIAVQGVYDGPDQDMAFTFQQFNSFQDGLICSNPEDLSFNVTEWNARYSDYLGLQQASMQIEVFYELVSNGVDAAQTWPLTFDTQDRSLLDVDDPLSGLSISGEMFRLMSESLVGLSPIFDFAVTVGQGSNATWLLDAHGFGTEDKTVVFVSERSGEGQADVSLDLSNYMDTNQTYFVTVTELWDGGAGGNNSNAEPVVSYIGGTMVTGTQFNFSINSWANLRLEITAVGNGDDYVLARDGNDAIETFGGDDTIDGGSGNDSITASSGDDSVDGGEGNDQIIGGNGQDILYGRGGNDTIRSGNDNDFISAGDGNDVASGGRGTDVVLGGAGDDSLGGGAGRDSLNGGTGHDFIVGGFGNDMLLGGPGEDVLRGGAGNDAFVFNTAPGARNVDRITDFAVIDDTIRLDDAVFVGLASGNLAASAFAANLTGVASDGLDRIIYETDTGRLYFDADGSGVGARVHFATLSANLTLTSADFVVF